MQRMAPAALEGEAVDLGAGGWLLSADESDSSSLLFGALSTMPISPSFVTRSSVKIVWLGIGRDQLEALPLLAGPACLLCWRSTENFFSGFVPRSFF